MEECTLHKGFYVENEDGMCPRCMTSLKKNVLETNVRLRRWRDENKEYYESIKDKTPFRPIGKRMCKEIRKQKEKFKKGKIEEIYLTAFTSSFAENLRRHMNKYHSDLPFKIEVANNR